VNAGPLIYFSGRVTTTSADPNVIAPNAIPFKAGSICVGVAGMAIASHVSGYAYGPTGRIAIEVSNAVPVDHYVAGLGITAAGRLACDTSGAIDHYVRGLPVTAQGRVAIVTPT
jgi:hypothetical protein